MMEPIGVSTEIQAKILQEISDERLRQDNKWGVQQHPDLYWLAILTEEVGEVAKELCDLAYTLEHQSLDIFIYDAIREKIKKELIQVAAVAVAWIEDSERNK